MSTAPQSRARHLSNTTPNINIVIVINSDINININISINVGKGESSQPPQTDTSGHTQRLEYGASFPGTATAAQPMCDSVSSRCDTASLDILPCTYVDNPA